MFHGNKHIIIQNSNDNIIIESVPTSQKPGFGTPRSPTHHSHAKIRHVCERSIPTFAKTN